MTKKGERVFQPIPPGWNAFVRIDYSSQTGGNQSVILLPGPAPCRPELIHSFSLSPHLRNLQQIYTLEGETLVGDSLASSEPIKQYHTAVLSNNEGETGVWLESASSSGRARFVLVAGEPLEQQIYQSGPFVMTSREEIQQAFMDYQFERNVRFLFPTRPPPLRFSRSGQIRLTKDYLHNFPFMDRVMVRRVLKARMVGGARSANGSVPLLSFHTHSLSLSSSRSLAPNDTAYSTSPDDRSMKRNTCDLLSRVSTL